MSFTAPFYPIVYVRGFAPTRESRRETFQDAYYGYAQTAVVVRPKPPVDSMTEDRDRQQLDLFEGQLIRFMKEFDYVDATHSGLALATQMGFTGQRVGRDPTRSIWVSRFYDTDHLSGKVRPIIDHARDLRTLIEVDIPAELENTGVDLGINRADYKVILIAHSMGGLVCRALLQNLYPGQGIDPKNRIHRLVTIASPHKGIEFGVIPDLLENFIVNTLNPADTGMFYDRRMREYLQLDDDTPLNSLGNHGSNSFPAERCFCLIGSDYKSYDKAVATVTGNYSDGLVKQDHAFIEGAFTANVHRAHSSADHGIVNSFQSYENIHRFLFGDTRVDISLEDFEIMSTADMGEKGYYNLEFRYAIRNAGSVYLHEKREDPCENADRFLVRNVPRRWKLHTAFLNSARRVPNNDYSHFQLSLRVTEHRVKSSLFGLMSEDYPTNPIFSETLEMRINSVAAIALWTDPSQAPAADLLQSRWLSEDKDQWTDVPFTHGLFEVELRSAPALKGKLRFEPFQWNKTEGT